MPIATTVKVGELTVTVRELLLEEVRAIYTAPDRNVVDAVAHLLSMCCTAKVDDLLKQAPSDIQPLIDKMLEVNKAFFDQAAALEFEQTAAELRRLILKISTLAYFTSSPPDTEKEFGNTPIANS